MELKLSIVVTNFSSEEVDKDNSSKLEDWLGYRIRNLGGDGYYNGRIEIVVAMIGGDWGRSIVIVSSCIGEGERLGSFSISGLLYLIYFIFVAIAVLA